MSYLKRILLVSSVLGIVAAVAVPAHAALITLTQTGTWNTAPGRATQDAMLQMGGNYFITTTYDDTLPTMSRVLPGGITVHEIALNTPGNSFDISIPMLGFGPSFSYMQDEMNHLPLFITNPVIQFSSPSPTASNPTASNFVGYEFEGDFVSDATTNFVQLFTEVAIVDVGGVLVPTRSQVVQIMRCEDGFACNDIRPVIRSVNSIPAVPLPASLPLLAAGLVGLGALARRRRMRA